MVETGRFYIKPFMSICNKENSPHPAQVLFFAGTSLSLLLDTVDKSGSVFFCIAFLSNEFHKRRRQTSLPHTVSHKCLKSLFYCTQLRFFHVNLLDTLEEDCQILWFINPVVDWDDEEDKILELERSFSGVFNTFVNQWCVK